MSNRVVVIVGPTASGKTELSLRIAEKFGGEIVSADSMQIYRHLDIGTAKPTVAERRSIPHHMIDIAEPTENFTLADFLSGCRESVSDILERGALPVIAGGTGLYISSFTDNITLTEVRIDPEYRAFLVSFAQRVGGSELKKLLEAVDPVTSSRLHENDIKRLSRALEMYRATGETLTDINARSKSVPSLYDFLILGLTYENRDTLYSRIDRRVDMMFDRGLEKEVKDLADKGILKSDTTAGQAIGYKEFFPYFENKASLTEVKDKIKQESRRYAKRQLTWFRRDQRIKWKVLNDSLTEKDISDILEITGRFLSGGEV